MASETFPIESSTGIQFLPSRYCHEVTIRVVIEQWADGIVSEKTALTHSFLSADSIDKTIAFDNAPLAWQSPKVSGNKTYGDALRQDMLEQSKWLPRLTVLEDLLEHGVY